MTSFVLRLSLPPKIGPRGPFVEPQVAQAARLLPRPWAKTVPMTGFRRIALVVALANLAWFGVEFAVALKIGSVSLFADSIDFLEDTTVNLLIVVALGWSMRRRGQVGLLLAALLLVPGRRRCGRPGASSSRRPHPSRSR